MLNILTGPPKHKQDDLSVCKIFSTTKGTKIICGSSTMKMYCRELNIIPKITLMQTDDVPAAEYKIEGVHVATEGIITLNECYKSLSGLKSNNKEAILIAKLLTKYKNINFVIGTSDNKEHSFYKLRKLFTRTEIIKKIISLLPEKNITLKMI